jgi:uncharacterized protein (TIGR02145 family)
LAPVNVGATSTTYSTGVAGCGYHFQWGRNVPFTYNTGDIVAGPLFADEAASDINKSKFITSGTGDWLKPGEGEGEGEDDDRWQGDNAQGPCPNGWRVPTADELTVLQEKYVAANFDVGDDNRLKIVGDTGQNLYLPAAGYRRDTNGGWTAQGTWGSYWSSTASATKAMYFGFNGNPQAEVSEYNRAYGYSVRCIQK